MEHESFEHAETARLMNERFVNVKVDREERPDVDAVYMDAVVAMSGHGGWPMTVFVTPDGEPFFGGTYYPPEPRHGLPSFRQLLVAVSDAYRERRDDVTRQAQALVEAVREQNDREPSSEPLTAVVLDDAVRGLRSQFDPEWGGFGRAPKFPPASALEFLLRRGELDVVTKTLDGMTLGGMYDVVGGGFHRYSVDERWLVPHYEKMLYDNALLVPAYLHGWARTGDERYRTVAAQTVDYMVRELWIDGEGFASSQDADTDGVEGTTYTWAPGEGAPNELLEPFEHGRSILRGEVDEATRARLLATRDQRPQPARDDKVITSWNGLALAALAEAGRMLERPDLLQVATRLAELLTDGELVRSRRAGRASVPGFLDDYANVAHGLYELHVATGDPRWLHESRRLALLAIERFEDDERGGFFMSARDAEALVVRRKDLDDHPTPSGNSMLAFVLLRLARIWGDDELKSSAAGVFRLLLPMLARAPSAFGWTLVALDLDLSPSRELALLAEPGDDVARAVLAGWDPHAVVAFGPDEDVPLLAGKTRVDEKPTVYECERFVCRAPVTDADAILTNRSPTMSA
jgi:uncharacterized protein YyaL (SSP411 family)